MIAGAQASLSKHQMLFIDEATIYPSSAKRQYQGVSRTRGLLSCELMGLRIVLLYCSGLRQTGPEQNEACQFITDGSAQKAVLIREDCAPAVIIFQATEYGHAIGG